MSNLNEHHGLPGKKKTPPLTEEAALAIGKGLRLPWLIVTEAHGVKKLSHEFTFANFPVAVSFVDQIVPIAETEEHHPDLHIFYNRVRVELYTHSIRGLSANDFIMAAKIEIVYNQHDQKKI